MAKILLVEDDLELCERLKDWFSLENHVVEDVTSGEDALQMLRNYHFDIVVLDWSLPGMSGVEVCKKFRGEGGRTPILFLTGKTDVEYRETGLDSGADDYLVKPFDTRELSARIRSILRRPPSMHASDLNIGGIMLKPDTRTVIAGGDSAHLKPKECALLEYLMRNPNKLFSAKELLEAVWPSDTEASTDSVRTWMKLLRRQLAAIGKPDLIKTVLGSGYMLDGSAG